MNKFELIKHADAQTMAHKVSRRIVELLKQALKERASVVMVTAGGATPVATYRQLAQQPLAWDRVNLLLTDERWVPEEHPDSNWRMLSQNLLWDRALRANFTAFPIEGNDRVRAAETMERRLAHFPGLFDLVLVGMGYDGHVASLFPGSSELAPGLSVAENRTCVAVTPPPGVPHARLSLTLPRLLRTRHLLLLIQGNEKLTVLENGLSPGPVYKVPVRGLLQQNLVLLEIHWSP